MAKKVHPNPKKNAPRKPVRIDMPSGETPNGSHCTVVGFGASAGGMEAFLEVLAHMPPDSGLALVLVQHLDPNHQSVLTELLGRSTPMPVLEIQDGMRAEPNHVYVIPPNASLAITDGVLHLGERGWGQPMPIDSFLRSLAEGEGSKAIGVILSGTASDGTLGLKAIKAEGGITFAQEPGSAKYDGMPRSAIAAGCVDLVLNPRAIAAELVRLCKHPYVADLHPPEPEQPEPNFNEIITMLRNSTGVDFTFYKNATIRRRILRRMALKKLTSPEKYLALLKEDRDEVPALFNDILINVTGFFREPSTFDFLKTRVLPSVFRDRTPDDQVRVWVAGCSTGEEAYSMGITLLEYMRENGIETSIQIFGTDLSDTALEKARAGVYPETIMAEVSAERLRKYFNKVNGNFQIARSVRDLCIFARQNLTKDPPFSRLDLISCRNVMIYLGPVLQQKLLRVFHYALRPQGYLVLGTSETIGAATEMFHPLDRRHRVYARKDVPATAIPLSLGAYDEIQTQLQERKANPAVQSLDLERRVDHLLASRYAPAGVVVDSDLRVLQFRGRTAPYLEHGTGEANLNLIKMLRGGLGVEVKKLVQKSRAKDTTARSEPLQLSEDGGMRHLRVSVTPMLAAGSDNASSYLVLFEDVVPPMAAKDVAHLPPGTANRRVKDLEQELSSTKLYLQSVIEEQEATTEELKSANEEIQSSNEELQSTNEELLTAKEELQSTNEELTTVNEEMQGRNAELTQTNNDLSNLLSSVNIPIIMLGNDLRLRRFTPQAEKFFNLLPSDVGRPLADFKPKIVVPDMEQLFLQAIDNLSISEREVHDKDGRYYSMWIRPYRTSDNKIDGAVMTLFDITERKNLADVRFRRLFEASRDATIVTDSSSGEVLDLNPAAAAMINLSRQEVNGRRLRDLGVFAAEDFEDLAASIAATGSWQRPVIVSARDGSRSEVEVLANVYDEGDRKVIQLNLRDLSRRRRAGEWDQTMDGLERATLPANIGGRPASELARDFNGFLASIIQSADQVEQRLGGSHEAALLLREIKDSGERAAAVGRLLLALGGISQAETLDLGSVVADVIQLMQFTFPANISVKAQPPAEPVRVTTDRFPARQIFLELVGGARERMPRGGTISLDCLNEEITEEFSRDHPAVPPGRYGVLRITDTGTSAVRDGRFPSAGLLAPGGVPGWLEGLQAAIRLAGGYLWCYSELGKGSTYSVYFPRALD